ncbi:MAG: protein kinase domain-containing protein [Planctomycetota bacterium]|jgi:hypothetical protein
MPIDEQLGARLAAYLDGEADEEERRTVEKLISENSDARRALDEMREARQLLHEYDTQTSSAGTAALLLPDLSGRRMDHFIVERRIGRGGMGEVYRGADTSLDRPVAIKLISPGVAATPQLVDRFVREARVQAQIDHPHVAHVYHVGRYEERLYFAMEYLPGGSLEDRLQMDEKPEPEEAIDVVVEVADILDSTRRQGIVHRDLKPSNIMFTGDGSIKLSDFGIAKPGGEEITELTDSGALLGTPHYISPEAAAGEEVTWRSDMYSLGCTLYRLLFGRPPYQARGPVQLAVAHIQEPFPQPRELPPGVSEELLDVVRRMMAKDPMLRFPDYASLVEALNSARPRIIEPISPWKRFGVGLLDTFLAAAIVLSVFLMASGAVAVLTGRQPGEALLPVVWALVGVLYAGLIPAFSGSTLVQSILAMRVRTETAGDRPRGVLFWRGLLAHPMATFGVATFAVSWSGLPEDARGALGFLILLGLTCWHITDFVVAFFDGRRRLLHDVLFRTRLQYVTYRD